MECYWPTTVEITKIFEAKNVCITEILFQNLLKPNLSKQLSDFFLKCGSREMGSAETNA